MVNAGSRRCEVSVPLLLILVVTLAARGCRATRHRYESEADVDMDLHTLNLLRGREARVPCRINRPLMELMNSAVEFIHEPQDYNQEPVVLTHNGVLMGADPEYYGIELSTTYDQTIFTLVYKSPRLQDQGYLRCRFVPSQDIAPPGLRSTSNTRYVLVF